MATCTEDRDLAHCTQAADGSEACWTPSKELSLCWTEVKERESSSESETSPPVSAGSYTIKGDVVPAAGVHLRLNLRPLTNTIVVIEREAGFPGDIYRYARLPRVHLRVGVFVGVACVAAGGITLGVRCSVAGTCTSSPRRSEGSGAR